MALMYCRECGKQVSSEAPSCPHCGVPNPVLLYSGVPAASAHRHALVPQHRDPAIAAVLSFFIPGSGQMYKGHVGAGFGWLLAVFLGYLALILPGLVLHVACVVNAAKHE